MNWKNLRTNRCPKCPCKLHPIQSGGLIMCNSKKCDFKIKPDRMKEIVSGMNEKEVEKSINNQELLNNL